MEESLGTGRESGRRMILNMLRFHGGKEEKLFGTLVPLIIQDGETFVTGSGAFGGEKFLS